MVSEQRLSEALLRAGLPPLLQEREHGRVLLPPDQLVGRHAEAPPYSVLFVKTLRPDEWIVE